MKYTLLLILFFTSIQTIAEQIEQDVSHEKYNTFIFDKPFKTLIFETGSFVEKPIPLQGNNGFLLRLKPNQNEPFQLITQLVNGETLEFRLTPLRNMEKGHVYRRNGAGIFSMVEGEYIRPSDKWVVDVLSAAVRGATPVGFMKEGKPQYKQSKTLKMLPVAKFTNNIHELLIYELRSEFAFEIQPKDFWQQGVIATQLEGDIVSHKHRPILFILQEIKKHGE